jgi:hypothetical protein
MLIGDYRDAKFVTTNDWVALTVTMQPADEPCPQPTAFVEAMAAFGGRRAAAIHSAVASNAQRSPMLAAPRVAPD